MRDIIRKLDQQAGYSPEELEHGEDTAWHIPIWGCLIAAAGLAAIGWLLLR